MKINEFVNEDNIILIKKINELIYFDEKWMFPEYNLNGYLERTMGRKIPKEFNELAQLIVKKFNDENIPVDCDFDAEYDRIYKSITKL